MRVAVIGAGSMGGMHAWLLGGLPAVTEILLVEPDAARATAVAAEVGARVASFDEAFESAEAVIIASPSSVHAVSVAAAVAAETPALCEKPLTEDLASSAALVELVERAGAHVEMGFQRRHDVALRGSADAAWRMARPGGSSSCDSPRSTPAGRKGRPKTGRSPRQRRCCSTHPSTTSTSHDG